MQFKKVQKLKWEQFEYGITCRLKRERNIANQGDFSLTGKS